MSDITSLPLPKTRNLFFSDGVDLSSIGKLSESIIEIETNDKYLKKLYSVHGLSYNPDPIKIFIDSYGGIVYQVLGLISIMDACKTPIHTYSTGCTMSCGFLMLISGHRRFVYKHSTLLYHQVSNWLVGKLEDLKDDLKETKRLQKLIDSIVLEKTNLTKNKLKEINTIKKDWYMTANEALEYGVVDEIL